ncbi:hypothetical protein FA13DRAFT_1734785 [Coprinellus micaceus]|uniref:Nephrocystin 3-like N-terminal domain-containing protein n=1 Tax=Coprinellus micaceus TaxID=71717 RepID=A0A4Y7T6J0_COPMI|nr:hypothetical protein FA13DRAFT_1734785 [Coprinellus micaceus]
MFANAHNFNIERLQISTSAEVHAFKNLYDNIAVCALHNCSERSEAPKCYPRTRVAVREEILSWMAYGEELATLKKLLWLTGPAGSGKTAIMGSIADEFHKKGDLAATFFFSSLLGSRYRRTKLRFIATLAYQLIQHPDLGFIKQHILSIVSRDPAIFEKQLKEQMEVLILQPLREFRRNSHLTAGLPKIILIDGLDECDPDWKEEVQSPIEASERHTLQQSKEEVQVEILGALLQAVNDPAFPYKVAIASRPERIIRRFFSFNSASRCVEMFLGNGYNPDRDITVFLESKFEEIRRNHPHLPDSWPGDLVIRKLVKNASGQFIYVATVLRFVETPSNSPRVQLEIALSLRPPSPASPFNPLDALYARVLNTSSDPMLAIKWLKAYCYLDIDAGIRTWFFNRLCESSEGEVENLFENMSALVYVSDQRSITSAQYTFYHKSFQDFLGDPDRYGAYFPLTEEDALEWIIRRFIYVFNNKAPKVQPDIADSCHLFECLDHFSHEVIGLWFRIMRCKRTLREADIRELIESDAAWWISRINMENSFERWFTGFMFVKAHSQCQWFKPCTHTCRKWREPISGRWTEDAGFMMLPGKLSLLLDRFDIRSWTEIFFRGRMGVTRDRFYIIYPICSA